MDYSPCNSQGQNTRVGSLTLLQGIFPTQGSNPGLPHCRQILYQLSHQGSPRILERVAYPVSSGSSRPRNWTGVSCIAGRFFTSWATRAAQYDVICKQWQFYFFLSKLDVFYVFLFSDVARTSNTILNKSDKSGNLCFAPDFRGNASNVLALNIRLAGIGLVLYGP